MNQQTLDNIPPFLADLKKMATCIHIAAEPSAAADVSLKTKKSIDVIERLLVKNKELEYELGQTKIQLEHKTTLLASCEKALEERDNL